MTNLVGYTNGHNKIHACPMKLWNVPDGIPVASQKDNHGYLVVYGLRTDKQTQVWISEEAFNAAGWKRND